jgi:hypothetical protein
MDAAFNKDLEALSARVLSLTNRLLALAATADPRGKGKGPLENQDNVVDNFHSLVVDPMDQLLERTASSNLRFALSIVLILTKRTFALTSILAAPNHPRLLSQTHFPQRWAYFQISSLFASPKLVVTI